MNGWAYACLGILVWHAVVTLYARSKKREAAFWEAAFKRALDEKLEAYKRGLKDGADAHHQARARHLYEQQRNVYNNRGPN